MFFNNNYERPDVFLDEGIMFRVSPNPGLNLTHLRTTGPSWLGMLAENCAKLDRRTGLLV